MGNNAKVTGIVFGEKSKPNNNNKKKQKGKQKAPFAFMVGLPIPSERQTALAFSMPKQYCF